MKHTPITRAALHGHIVSVPLYQSTVDCTAQSLRMRIRLRRVLWALLFGSMFGMFMAVWWV